ncbi:hypothetical protein E2562_013568 [Oryza meyeriana var. granulata]|uniref:Uncharacterized protein n=1 Tax=Oryza meyeriana var. granulata TaxID=110450 RepID=A0A6G1D5I0_9ORYZ|nr:hypothetical protein E2562_013568 [Oryza meyeriana var. granulata]
MPGATPPATGATKYSTMKSYSSSPAGAFQGHVSVSSKTTSHDTQTRRATGSYMRYAFDPCS